MYKICCNINTVKREITQNLVKIIQSDLAERAASSLLYHEISKKHFFGILSPTVNTDAAIIEMWCQASK